MIWNLADKVQFLDQTVKTSILKVFSSFYFAFYEMMDVHYTYCGNHFMMYEVKSLCCTPYTVLYVSYISIKLEEKETIF